MSETNINCDLNIFDDFNQRVINAHYINGENELIDRSEHASLNCGEITYQKGACAFRA